MRSNPFVLALSAGSVLVVATLAVACSGPDTISLSAREFSFTPSTLFLRAGVPVRLTLVNDGAIEHDFTVEGMAGGPVQAKGSQELGHAMDAAASNAVHVSAHSGERVTAEFVPTAGTFEYYCSVPGHREANMRGTLRVVQ